MPTIAKLFLEKNNIIQHVLLTKVRVGSSASVYLGIVKERRYVAVKVLSDYVMQDGIFFLIIFCDFVYNRTYASLYCNGILWKKLAL